MCRPAEILRPASSKHNANEAGKAVLAYCKWLVRQRNGDGYLQINDKCYRISERSFTYVDGDSFAGRLWILRQPDGTTYQVTMDRDGDLGCDCPDAVYRHEGKDCKHCKAVRAAYRWLEERQQIELALQVMDQTEAPF